MKMEMKRLVISTRSAAPTVSILSARSLSRNPAPGRYLAPVRPAGWLPAVKPAIDSAPDSAFRIQKELNPAG
jgi:hypothetical protein